MSITRWSNFFRKGKITAITNEQGSLPMMQVLKDGENANSLHDSQPLVQNYGHAGIPPIGSGCHVIHADGSNNKPVIVTTYNQSVPGWTGMNPGDSKIYDNGGDSIWLSNGTIFIVAESNVNVTAPNTTINGNAQITENLTVTGTLTAGVIMTTSGINLAAHVHGGVSTGSGETGGPIG